MVLFKAALIAFSIAVVGVFCSQHYACLKQQDEIARFKKENEEMRLAISERLSSPPHAGQPAARDVEGDFARIPIEVSSPAFSNRPTSPAEDSRWPTRRYLNAGQATPIAALQTMAWACDQADVDTMKKLFVIDPEARPKADAIYAAIPIETRTKWNCVEALAAMIIVHNGIEQPYPGTEVLAQARIQRVTEGRVMLLLPGAVVSGVTFQQTADGWKYVISDAVIDDYIRRRMASVPER